MLFTSQEQPLELEEEDDDEELLEDELDEEEEGPVPEDEEEVVGVVQIKLELQLEPVPLLSQQRAVPPLMLQVGA